jgi:hypothetical protein
MTVSNLEGDTSDNSSVDTEAGYKPIATENIWDDEGEQQPRKGRGDHDKPAPDVGAYDV